MFLGSGVDLNNSSGAVEPSVEEGWLDTEPLGQTD